jgi:FAD dependent oxidoreductase
MDIMRVRVPNHSQRHVSLQQAACAPCQHQHRRQRAWQVACHSRQTGKKVVVVGAGVGGICLAGRLARRGFDVTVVEQNEHVSRGAHCMNVQSHALSTQLNAAHKFREVHAWTGDAVTLRTMCCRLAAGRRRCSMANFALILGRPCCCFLTHTARSVKMWFSALVCRSVITDC